MLQIIQTIWGLWAHLACILGNLALGSNRATYIFDNSRMAPIARQLHFGLKRIWGPLWDMTKTPFFNVFDHVKKHLFSLYFSNVF